MLLFFIQNPIFMLVNSITPANVHGDQLTRTASLPYHTNQLERALLLLIAAVGILGSIYIFSATSGSTPPEYQHSIAPIYSEQSSTADDEWKAKFKNYIKIEGKKQVGQSLNFTFVGEKEGGRYVLEMGNGNRMIITGRSFPFTYTVPGKYKLELKKIQKGLITNVASQNIRIKG